MFNEMKAWLKTNEVEDYQFCYDDPYSDYTGELYWKAVERLQKEVGDDTIFVEPSIQCGCGCNVMYTKDGRSEWDFESECESIFEFAEEAETEEELISSIYGYLMDKYEDRSEDDDDYDEDDEDEDEEDEEE